MDDNGRYVLALHLVSGIGAVTYRRLLSRFGTPEAVLSAPAEQLLNLPFLGEKRAKVIERGRTAALERADEEIRRAEKEGVEIIPFSDKQYPAPLRSIFDPPLAIYVKGQVLPDDVVAVAVVGTRRPSVYGLSTGERIAIQLAGRGFTVVSGLAYGIDSSAHRGALKGGGRTLAVLGSGLDKIYPKDNEKLAEEIQEHGALITELPFGTSPSRQTFPRRNRLISGLSLGVVVVEGKENSGALITARCAMEQGREVFAVPGKIDDRRSRGPHLLIKQGAKLIEGIEDILDELGPVADFMKPPHPPPEEAPSGEGNIKEGTVEKARLPAASTMPDEVEPVRQAHHSDADEKILTSPERAILGFLGDEPIAVDEIIAETGLSPAEVASHLMVLEIRRLVKQLPGKLFVREDQNAGLRDQSAGLRVKNGEETQS